MAHITVFSERQKFSSVLSDLMLSVLLCWVSVHQTSRGPCTHVGVWPDGKKFAASFTSLHLKAEGIFLHHSAVPSMGNKKPLLLWEQPHTFLGCHLSFQDNHVLDGSTIKVKIIKYHNFPPHFVQVVGLNKLRFSPEICIMHFTLDNILAKGHKGSVLTEEVVFTFDFLDHILA